MTRDASGQCTLQLLDLLLAQRRDLLLAHGDSEGFPLPSQLAQIQIPLFHEVLKMLILSALVLAEFILNVSVS